MTVEKRVYTQREINNLIRILTQRIFPYRHLISYVVGIANGGLHVSQPIATALQLPHRSVRISLYDGYQLREQPIIEGQPPKENGLLVVDDLIDGGGTMRLFDEKFGTAHMSAVLFCKTGGYIPNFFAAVKPKEWVIFPWSREEDDAN